MHVSAKFVNFLNVLKCKYRIQGSTFLALQVFICVALATAAFVTYLSLQDAIAELLLAHLEASEEIPVSCNSKKDA